MKIKHLTYRELFARLEELGYSKTTMSQNGKRQWLLRHDKDKDAFMLFPEMPLDQSVEPMHLGKVRVTLKTHGLIEDKTSGI